MATNYFRVVVYHPTEDISVIFDSYGLYEKLWQFSSFMLSKGFQVIEVSNADQFLDGNITKTETTGKLVLRANQTGKPKSTIYEQNGIHYTAVQVEGKIYIPDRTKVVA